MTQKTLAQLNFKDISDWFIHVDSPEDSIVYPLGQRVKGYSKLQGYADRIIAASEKCRNKDDFSITVEGLPLRLSRFRDVEKETLSVRRGESSVPNIDDLSLPNHIVDIISDNKLLKTGLIIVSGAHGGGKSTTCAAIVKRRLESAGGIARTIEDPIEFPLSGALGKGFCFQTALNGSLPYEQEMELEIKKAMRGYPTGQYGILMFGEIRDASTAAEALRASLAGRLVICTIHANNIQDVLFRVVSRAQGRMGSDEIYDVLKSSLKLIIHQDIKAGKLIAKSLIRTGKLASILHHKKLDGIIDETNRQSVMTNQGQKLGVLYD